MIKYTRCSDADLYELFEIKYGGVDSAGWSPRRRLKFGYYQAGDIYEATVKKLVTKDSRWIDVGGGDALFPDNVALSSMLAQSCKKLVAVDPSVNVLKNPYAHEKIVAMFEDYQTMEKFDLATFRMVAEHINNPEAVLEKLNDLIDVGGIVVIYTINKFSPIPMITYITPFGLHYKIKRFFWGGEEKDTFPVEYKMNSRKQLKKVFTQHGFCEVDFQYLDDVSTFAKFKTLSFIELLLWRVLNFFHMTYPENNLLGVYQRQQ